ncbi:hypothetical protein FisN_1Hh208 [Fistulifera solaris]|uniref:Uncharacterized protein n=1 Tax=Fistulifera solaris TaxID=1519565 RepID=A0A1Z5JE58_FISSO|nr:hypothetical protein FisN_1Hh208 [Fistulifera solaris]|eukprot:GAX12277.1 hypothetical protein FisN_1Hh208 [Fistulifera solaris]
MHNQRTINSQRRNSSTPVRGLLFSVSLCCIRVTEGFGVQPNKLWGFISTTQLNIFAPPGSGYASLDDEQSALPNTYEPMMEFPGTMRPGRTPENMPFQDLPIGDNDPDPVPWPHFQQIEWHHRWDAPHEHPIPMEEFIELQGRWVTPEMEAEMRVGARKGVRERREMEESQKRDNVITDDDDDDDLDIPVALGDGIFGQLGSSADQAATAAATSPNRKEQEDEEEDLDDEFDDFLLDLGLDSEMEDDLDKKGPQKKIVPRSVVFGGEDDDDDDDDDIGLSAGGVTASIDVDDDVDLDLGLDDDDDVDDLDGTDTVPLEDFGDSDTMDTDDIFDEGGFDFDDADFDMDGGDMW